MDGLVPLDSLAAEGARAVADASWDTDAEAVGGAAVFPAGLGVVAAVLDHPDELFLFHQVERDAADGGLSFRLDAFGDIAEHCGLYHLGDGSVVADLM